MRYIGTWGWRVRAVHHHGAPNCVRIGRAAAATTHRSSAMPIPAVRFMETHECSPSPVDNSCGGPLALPCAGQHSCKLAKIRASSRRTSTRRTTRSQFITPGYAARIARVMGAVAASLARAPRITTELSPASGDACARHQHQIRGARRKPRRPLRRRCSVRKRELLSAADRHFPHHAQDQVISPPGPWPESRGQLLRFPSARADGKGHESLFAYPEVRCDATRLCDFPRTPINVTAPLPPAASGQGPPQKTTSTKKNDARPKEESAMRSVFRRFQCFRSPLSGVSYSRSALPPQPQTAKASPACRCPNTTITLAQSYTAGETVFRHHHSPRRSVPGGGHGEAGRRIERPF